ncbi:unnamed protein product [Ascophyllum nodosum]
MAQTMRERLSEKNGSRKTMFEVLHNKKYEEDMRFYGSSSQPQYISGDCYHGEWLENQRHGYGTKSWVNGSKYEGEWEKDKRNGKGTFWVKEAGRLRKQYAGDWKDDQRHGLGVFFHADGRRYEGGWESNRRSGQGLMTYTDGEARDVYDGGWLNGQRSGAGSLRLPNGDIFEGHWLQDKKEGPGRYLYNSTRKIYEGEWVEDTPKCGEYRDMPSEELVDASGPSDGSFALPVLTLKRSGAVLDEAIAIIRNDRAARHGQPGRIFTSNEMQALRDSFAAFDSSEHGLVCAGSMVEILNHAGFPVDPEDMQELLEELQAEPDTAISLPEFTEIVALLETEPVQERLGNAADSTMTDQDQARSQRLGTEPSGVVHT